MTLRDLSLAARSFVAVATSPAMPRWPAYRARVEADRARAPREVVERAADPDALVLALGDRPLRVTSTPVRIVSTLVSFADDHTARLPRETLPRESALVLLARLEAHAASEAPPLSVAEQLTLALALEPDAWTALLALHLATRQLARERDVRALGEAARRGLDRRCRSGRSIAGFPAALSQGGDPLGDTYHYWANVIAGVLAETLGGPRGAAIARLFDAGPTLMTLVRERAFGSRLFYGNHAAIDRLGLAHGRALAAHAAGVLVPRVSPRPIIESDAMAICETRAKSAIDTARAGSSPSESASANTR